MEKIRKVIMTAGVFFLTFVASALEINDLKFGERIEAGGRKSKEYILTNNTTVEKIYRLSIEEEYPVEIIPDAITLKSLEEKKFKIQVEGKQPVGKYEYFLNIKEINKEKSQDKVDINKNIRIKQEYIVE